METDRDNYGWRYPAYPKKGPRRPILFRTFTCNILGGKLTASGKTKAELRGIALRIALETSLSRE
jgi:hypothetical protein